MLLRPFPNDDSSCARYLFGRTTHAKLAVVDPHADLVDGGSCSAAIELPDYVVLSPGHYGGSVCGRGLSGNPVSSIGFGRGHDPLLALTDADAFADALLAHMPPRPVGHERIVAVNRSGMLRAAV